MNSQTQTTKKTSTAALQIALLLLVIGIALMVFSITMEATLILPILFIGGAFVAGIVGLAMKDAGR